MQNTMTRWSHRRTRALWCSASLVALLALTVATNAQSSGRKVQSPQTQPSTPSYRGDEELTRLRKSAERGDVQAAWDLCQLYSGIDLKSYHGRRVAQDDAVAVEWCRQAATHGHLRASGTLAAMYYVGRGVPQDFAQAVVWIRPPATAGVSEAQYLLGMLYAKGQGVPRDESQAFFWFLKSAEQGYAYAQNFVAAQYMSGQGTKRDQIEAHKWLNVCARRTSDIQDQCIDGRDAHAKSMSRADLAEAQKRADQWLATCPRPSEPRWNVVCQ
jgi:TPR repeat protein